MGLWALASGVSLDYVEDSLIGGHAVREDDDLIRYF